MVRGSPIPGIPHFFRYDFNRAIYIGSNSDPSVKTELDTKMSKMATSPFIFFRGTDHLFFDDMAAKTNDAYFIKYNNAATNITSLEGDLHLANFGAFEDSAGNVVRPIASPQPSVYPC